MRCFQLESRSTRECPKSRDFKLCSECSQEGHIWHQCLEQEKKCVNCNGAHSTMAMRCIKRKEIIKNKREEKLQRSKRTYTGAARTNLQPAAQPQLGLQNAPIVTREEVLKLHISIAHAKMKDVDCPGSYETELHSILKLNDLPTIKIPKETEVGVTSTQSIPPTTAPNTEHHKPKPKPRSDGIEKKERLTSEEKLSDDIQEMEEQVMPQHASELGLNFYTIKEKGWPQGTFTREDLLRGINKGQFKWTCSNNETNEREIIQLIKENKIVLNKCWNTVDKDVFRKIRCGIVMERSPLQEREPRQRRLSY